MQQKKTGLEEVTLVIFTPGGDPKLLKRLDEAKIPFQRIHYNDVDFPEVTSSERQSPKLPPTRDPPRPPIISPLPSTEHQDFKEGQQHPTQHNPREKVEPNNKKPEEVTTASTNPITPADSGQTSS